MTRPANIPDDAICINYRADNGKQGDYWIWNKWIGKGEQKERQYYWYALGKDGVEESGYEATNAARSWIRNGQSTKGKQVDCSNQKAQQKEDIEDN